MSIEARPGSNDASEVTLDIVARYKAELEKLDEQAIAICRDFGRSWAFQRSSSKELYAIASLFEADGDNWTTTVLDTAPAYHLYCALYPDGTPYEEIEFWKELGINEFSQSQPSYIRAFAEGAFEVWQSEKGALPD